VLHDLRLTQDEHGSRIELAEGSRDEQLPTHVESWTFHAASRRNLLVAMGAGADAITEGGRTAWARNLAAPVRSRAVRGTGRIALRAVRQSNRQSRDNRVDAGLEHRDPDRHRQTDRDRAPRR
jgi:hypothetical protein